MQPAFAPRGSPFLVYFGSLIGVVGASALSIYAFIDPQPAEHASKTPAEYQMRAEQQMQIERVAIGSRQEHDQSRSSDKSDAGDNQTIRAAPIPPLDPPENPAPETSPPMKA